jgi:hypothetical protein
MAESQKSLSSSHEPLRNDNFFHCWSKLSCPCAAVCGANIVLWYIYIYWTGVLLHSCGLLMLSIVKSCNMNTQKSCNANECSANFKQIAQIARKAPCRVFFLSTRKVLCSFFCFWNRHQIPWNPSSLYSLHCKSCSLLSCCTVSSSQENFRLLFHTF